MKRRNFFQLGAREAIKTAAQVSGVGRSRPQRAAIRPPFAVAEEHFAVACTHCGDCIEACSFKVLFKVPKDGAPAMDLLKHGCHLCSDWPCVTACETGALNLTSQNPLRPRLAKARINTDTCLPYSGPECGACRSACPVDGALVWSGGTKPMIDPLLCTGCALCREACIVEPKAVELAPLASAEGIARAS